MLTFRMKPFSGLNPLVVFTVHEQVGLNANYSQAVLVL